MIKDVAKYLVYFLLGIIFAITWYTAAEANKGVIDVRERVSVIECQLKDIAEIKADVKKLLSEMRAR